MTKRTELYSLAPDDIRDLMREALLEATTPLRREVAHLREQLHQLRPVITHKEAPAYFAGEVTPETIIDYCKNKGLPHSKQGRMYFIRITDLFDWQMSQAPAFHR